MRTVSGLAAAFGLVATAIAMAGQPSVPMFVHVTPPAELMVMRNVNPIKPVTAVIKIAIDKGYHLQGNNAKDPYIPTTATIKTPDGVTIGKIIYPPSVKKDFSGETLPVYESKIEIKVPITVSAKVKVGEFTLPVTINYQGCNDKSCYPPTNISTKITVKVGEAK